eukprot:11034017-Prorocentrum_lima.AAC.1
MTVPAPHRPWPHPRQLQHSKGVPHHALRSTNVPLVGRTPFPLKKVAFRRSRPLSLPGARPVPQ